jgi:hypothetical protein
MEVTGDFGIIAILFSWERMGLELHPVPCVDSTGLMPMDHRHSAVDKSLELKIRLSTR